MDKRSLARIGTWTTVALLGLGVASGAAYASTTASGTASAKAGHSRGGLLSRVEFGTVTVHTKGGDRTMDIQRGMVTATTGSPSSITVTTRRDKNHAQTYKVDANTKIHKQGKKASAADIKTGDRVFVIATHDGATATQIRDAGPAKAKKQA